MAPLRPISHNASAGGGGRGGPSAVGYSDFDSSGHHHPSADYHHSSSTTAPRASRIRLVSGSKKASSKATTKNHHHHHPKGSKKNVAAVKMIVERKIKIVTEQHNIDKPPVNEGFPMKEWTIEVYILDQDGREKPARCFTKAVYHLHPSFEQPIQTFTEPPFRCTNEGWGEFEMTIELFTTEKGGKQSIVHDLNFAAPQYENVHTISFKNPSQALQSLLRETGPLPSDEERKNLKKGGDGSKKKKTFDVERMADGLVKLNEDDLLQVIQLIHDGKDDGTFIQNNIDQGEFSVDLYTLPDGLMKVLWDYLQRANVLGKD
ncbi:yeats family-domain-containing protein [Apiosordaria backusii]|uniref:Yeats family-domain-containing protein n=1 Tax=Apiosordaria backusii TaxID=314023 RepID=A0AA40BMD5_9PEZI|nr:yeats family-domain-containing protein [Apiosordaria backusii]